MDLGTTSTSRTTLPCKVSVIWGLTGSLEDTLMVFRTLPLTLRVLKVALISPSPPGGIACVETTVAVQPQDPLAL
jgi:hypothetical protein